MNRMMIRLLFSTALSHVKHLPVLYQSFPFTLPSFVCQFYDASWYQVYSVYSRIIQIARYLKKYSTGWSQACSKSQKKYELNIFSYSFFRHCMQYAICSNAKYCNLLFGILFYVEQASQLCSLACTTVTDREFDFDF